MRKRFKELLLQEMNVNKDIVVLLGDVGYGMFDQLREIFPDRVINAGASEQLMIGMAVGLALDGKIPVCYSITPFLLYRPFEFIRNYLSEERIPVKLVGGGRDKDYGACGPTHFACEDIDVLSAIGGIEIIYPEFAEDINIHEFLYNDKPSYINLKK
tara:strand:- start:1324 stop:1794 length:471 start_codon:yes stop_codon:yes gene_type:complete